MPSRPFRRLLFTALLWLGFSTFALSARTLQDPRLVASDPRITGKMALGYCLPYAIALGDVLLERSGIHSQGVTVALYNPLTHQRLGAHIFVSYLDGQGQRWVVDNNRLRPTPVFTNDPVDWAVAVLHRPEMTAADIHLLFNTQLPASSPKDKSRFAKWMAWYHSPDYKKTIARERQDQQQLEKVTR
jgi:hypothetical protein